MEPHHPHNAHNNHNNHHQQSGHHQSHPHHQSEADARIVSIEPAAKKRPRIQLNSALVTGPSRIYIIEFLVILLSLALLLFSAIGLFNAVVDHLMDDSAGPASAYAAVLSVESIALYIATALVALPSFLLFYTRTRKAERMHHQLYLSRPRRRMAYVFMALGAITAIGYAISFVYTTTLALVNAESVSGGDSWLQSTLKQVFAIVFVLLLVFVVGRMIPGLNEDRK